MSVTHQNLKFVSAFSPDTSLFVDEEKHKVYVVKTVDERNRAYYIKIAQIKSPYLSPILSIEDSMDGIKIVRDYISGETLADYLQEKGKIEVCNAVKYIYQICGGLAELHKEGLVHRDINPNNILIASDGNVKIIDYGIVRSFANDKKADTVILGTPGYAAPEQFGFTQSDGRTDIYALGVLLNVMLTGKLPNEQKADGFLGQIVEKCLKMNPEQRYQNVEELQAAIQSSGKLNHADSFLRQIPGMRSKKNRTVLLSASAYIFALLLSISHFMSVKGGFQSHIVAVISYLFSAVIPFFCYHNFLNIWNKLPFTAGAVKRTQKIIYMTLGTLSLLFGIMIFGAMQPQS